MTGPLDQMRAAIVQARSAADAAANRATEAKRQARVWRLAAWLMFALAVLGWGMGAARALAAPVADAGVRVQCWHFELNGSRRLVWQATGSRVRVEQRAGRDVIVVVQQQREVEVVVEPGMACVLAPELQR